MTLGNKIVKRMKVLSLGACSTRHATYINFSLLQTGTSTHDERVYATLNRASDISRGRGPAKFRYFREIPKKARNTAKSVRNIAKYMSAKHI